MRRDGNHTIVLNWYSIFKNFTLKMNVRRQKDSNNILSIYIKLNNFHNKKVFQMEKVIISNKKDKNMGRRMKILQNFRNQNNKNVGKKSEL